MRGKRFFDVMSAFFLILIGFPLMIIIAFAILLFMGRPVLFLQARPGLKGRPFCMVKFRTMKDAADCNGNVLNDKERLTLFGKWLRSTSLDELPELWNVIKGDMSLVGPRPLLMEYLPLYTEEQKGRHDVRPGITGWAQINGRNAVSWEEKFKLDIWYVDNQSLLLDIKILLITVKRVFAREGISAEGHATTEKFTGNK